jgi:hypothetical protein
MNDMADLFMRSGADIEGGCRFLLWRVWDNRLPLAAWLMCNPSTADAEDNDPTLRRCIAFTRDHGCGGLFVVNVWPFQTPYPEVLWEHLTRCGYDQERRKRNLDNIINAGVDAKLRFVAFGCEPARRYPQEVQTAVAAFESPPGRVMSLGVNDQGWPLHPLARGKLAIPKGTAGRAWAWPE